MHGVGIDHGPVVEDLWIAKLCWSLFVDYILKKYFENQAL